MKDIQQSVIKKVDLKNRFIGSGSGRIRIDTSFNPRQLNFKLDSRLSQGKAFGESYDKAWIQAQSIDGVIVIQKGQLQRKKTLFNIKGTIDPQLKANLEFHVQSSPLQESSLLKSYGLPISGEFQAQGEIKGFSGIPHHKNHS